MKKLYSKCFRRSRKRTEHRMGSGRSIYFMLTLLMATVSVSHAQAAKLTINRQGASVSQVIADIERQTDYTFAYSVSALNSLGRVNINVTDASLDEVMTLCLKGSNYSYTVENNVVVIKQQPAPQQKMVTGRVVNKQTGKPIAGVSVVVAGTNAGVYTDADGNFRIAVRTPNPSLNFTFLGMKNVVVKAGDRTELKVEMEESSVDVGEVTVIAYGTRDKKELIGSVSSVKAADIDDMPAASLETLLQGQMAGVQVNNVSGSPGGGGSAVRIRGYNSLIDGNDLSGYASARDGSPLYVIDGVPVNSFTSPITGTNTLAEIDPATIASVEILKDAASAALYGSRASNGVVLITTKQGQSGRATFSANVSYSSSILPRSPHAVIGHGERLWRLEMGRAMIRGDRNGSEYFIPASHEDAYGKDPWAGGRGGLYDYFWNGGATGMSAAEMLETYRPLFDSINPFYNNASNFWKESFQVGKVLNANVSASGGNENIRYLVGAGFYSETGIQPGSDFSRYNLITNLTSNPVKNMKLDARIYLAYTERTAGQVSASALSKNVKYEQLYVNPSTTSSLLPSSGSKIEEILNKMNETAEKNPSVRMRASLYGSYNFLPELVFSTLVATDYSQSNRYSFEPEAHDIVNGSKSSASFMGYNVLTTENILSYNKSFADTHNLEVMAGYSYMRESDNRISGSAVKGPSDHVHYVDETWPSLYDNWGTIYAAQTHRSRYTETKMISWIGRVAYNYKKKYLMELTYRRDGSSTFGKNVRWADFPSVAVGWNFSDENFMRNFWWLNHGKLRVSWGSTGQTFGDPYLAHGLWVPGESVGEHVGMRPDSPLNSYLQWERSDQYDLGLDVDAWDNRVRFKLDYYYKYSSSILSRVDAPGNVYYHSKSWQNVMEISNEGLELEATFDILRHTAVKWLVKFNISRNWNRLEKTETGTDMVNGSSMLVIGRPIFGHYVLKSKGIVQKQEDIPVYWTLPDYTQRPMLDGGMPYMPGMVLYEDLNGDGNITVDDKYWAASTLPVAYGGIVTELSWNGFDLNALFTYSLGRHIINAYAHSSMAFSTTALGPLYRDPSKYTFWTKDGDGNTDYPSKATAILPYVYSNQYGTTSNKYLEKVSFIRLKQLTVGYKLPKEWTKAISLQSVRVFFTAENLFLLSNYSGLDPEVVDISSGVDSFLSYPLARKLTIGMTVNF